MRLKSIPNWVAGLFLLAANQVVVAAPSDARCIFPPGLRDEISQKYPGASLVTLADLDGHKRKLFQRDHGTTCPGLVKVNFYGDGIPTWALVLILGESPKRKAELVVARHLSDGWETRSLETTDGTPVVWRNGPGKYQGIDGKKPIRTTKPVIVFVGYESWAVVYAWNGKEVEKVQISD